MRLIFAPKWLFYGTPSFQQNAAFTCILKANWFSLLDHSAHKVKRSPFLAPNCRLNVWERSLAHSCTKLHIMRLLIWPGRLNQPASSQETQTAQFQNIVIESYMMLKGRRWIPQNRTYTILHTFGAKLVFRWVGWPLNFTTAFRTLGNGDANLARWCSNHCQLIRHSTICGKLQNLGHNRVGIWGMLGAWIVQSCENQSLFFLEFMPRSFILCVERLLQ